MQMESQVAGRVEALLDVRRYQDATRECVQALANFPQSSLLLALLVRCHLGTENLVEAERGSRQLIAEAPENAYVFYLRSIVMHEMKNFDAELAAANEAVRLVSDAPSLLLRLAEAQMQSGQLRQAKDTADQMIKLAPDDEDSLYLIGRIELQLENHGAAEKYFRAALAMAPNDINILNTLAVAVGNQKRRIEAIDLLHSALKHHSDNPVLQENVFAFIKEYLDEQTLRGNRSKALVELPQPIQMFYQDYRKRTHVLLRYSNYLMYLFWLFLLAGFALLLNLLS